MTIRYQFAKGDGLPMGWSVGNTDYYHVYSNVKDFLRFHTGKGFRIAKRPDDFGQLHRLKEVRDILHEQMLKTNLDTTFVIKSEDDDFRMLIRRHDVFELRGALIINHAKDVMGTGYLFGVTDCSWLTQRCYAREGVTLDHNAHLQRMDPQVIPITRSQIKRGDLVFHRDDDHVSLFLDHEMGGRVIDTEPHDAAAPWGGMFGTGVRIRSMQTDFYCDWEHVTGIGRLLKINGAP